MTFHVAFSADTFQVGAGPDPAPADPVVGSFTVTLDPAVAVTDATSGIVLDSLNLALGSSLSYSYNPAAFGAFPAGTLRVGGIAGGSDVIQFNPATNDFWLFIEDFTTGSPTFRQLGYTQTSVSSNNLFFTINQTGSATVQLPLAGDYNNSGLVEQGDLDLVLLNWGTSGTPAGWINQVPVGIVDQSELDGVLLNWGNTPEPVGHTVPEPALLFALGGLVLAGVRRRGA